MGSVKPKNTRLELKGMSTDGTKSFSTLLLARDAQSRWKLLLI